MNAARTVLAALLGVVAVVAVTLAVPARWLEGQILDTDQYVATVRPLATDEAVQESLADLTADAVLDRIDLTRVVPERLGEDLAGTVQEKAREGIRQQTLRILDTEAWQQVWDAANRAAHDDLVAVLTGQEPDGVAVEVQQGRLVLDLSPLLERVRDRLVDLGVTVAAQIPVGDFVIELASTAEGLDTAQQVVRELERWADVLPWVALVALLGALGVARRRGTTLALVGVGALVGAGASWLALRAVRSEYVEGRADSALGSDAAGSVFDITTRALRDDVVTLAVVAAVATAVGLALAVVERRRRRPQESVASSG